MSDVPGFLVLYDTVFNGAWRKRAGGVRGTVVGIFRYPTLETSEIRYS